MSISKNVLCLIWTGEMYFADKIVGGKAKTTLTRD